MRIASVGVSRFCFLFSLAFCGLLLLLIPVLQPPTHQVDLPQPRTQLRHAQSGNTSHYRWVPTESYDAGDTGWAVAMTGSPTGPLGSSKDDVASTANRSFKRRTDYKTSPEKGSVLDGNGAARYRDLLELKDIFIAVKTTRKYHKSRLELLVQTWVSQAKEQVSVLLLTIIHVASRVRVSWTVGNNHRDSVVHLTAPNPLRGGMESVFWIVGEKT